jgi:hypothetical protein
MVAWRSLVELEKTADLIVVGTASDAAAVGNLATFTVQVDRVVKGDRALAGKLIRADLVLSDSREISLAGRDSPLSGHGLWFFQRSSSGWHLLPIVEGDPLGGEYIPAPAGAIPAAYAYAPETALSDKIASEVSAAIEGAATGDLRLLPLHQSALLDVLASPISNILYRRMAASGSLQSKILGLSGLIREGNSTALESAFSAARSFQDHPREMNVLISSIQGDFRAADPASVAILGRVTAFTNGSLAFRLAAAHALASIHTQAALPYLAALLDDANGGMRAEAVGGLASFANGLPIQTPSDVPSLRYTQLPASSPYMTSATVENLVMGEQTISRNEAKYLSFWKAWWQQNRSGLGY